MAEAGKCPRCGTNLSPDNAGGLCPRCLIGLNLSNPTVAPTGCETDTPDDQPGRHRMVVVPSPAEIAAYFPELEILGLIGRGGMGAVYMARQPRLDRLVALKILPPKVDQDPSFAERFTREAQAMARLNHPHIVTLYEFGQKESLFYFLMEYVDGVNLRQLLNTSRLAAREALVIVPQICEALQYAHERGIVHRDIKPENLLLNKQGVVKIADFGIAKLVTDRIEQPAADANQPSPETGLTKNRGTLGTPQYMAPEQLAQPLGVDHRADIYSLGVVFYQMLTGELPAGKFDPPSNKVVIDVRLDQVVLRALEKQPDRRYQQISEVRKDLETISQNIVDSTADAASTASIASKRRVARYIIGALCVLLICGMVFWGRHNQAQAPSAHPVVSRTTPGWQTCAPADLLKGRSSSTAVWTGEQLIVFGGEGMNVTFGDGALYDFAQNIWSPLALQGAAPSARTAASAIWTGSAMIVWGGFGGSFADDVLRNDGARFNPSNSVWSPISSKNTPTARFSHTALWTGREMLIWGGYSGPRMQMRDIQVDAYLNTGGRYDSEADVWRDITTNGAPSPRVYSASVWTGKEMIVWGGLNASGDLGDGARYDPVTDVWKPMGREGAPGRRSMSFAAWTGSEMVVWGGVTLGANTTYFQDGARYHPETDSWTSMTTVGAPKGTTITDAVWTGREMIIWGGVNDTGTTGTRDPKRYVEPGGRYNPANDTWAEMPLLDAPAARAGAAVRWNGTALFVFGGYNGKHLNDLHYYFAPGESPKSSR